MKKFKLNLDEIKVESFETKSIQSKQGTVVGNQVETYTCPGWTEEEFCYITHPVQYTCNNQATCYLYNCG